MEPITAIEKKPPEEQAKIALYEIDGKPYLPGVNLQRSLVSAATFSKGKGRGSLQKPVAAGLFIDEEILPLNGKTSAWVIDSRPVVVPATKGRIVRHRPKFEKWETHFTITYDETLLTGHQVREVVDNAGSRVGVLDFRPEKKGPFGRFMVTAWEEV
jgi:hypothetical protein